MCERLNVVIDAVYDKKMLFSLLVSNQMNEAIVNLLDIHILRGNVA